VSKLFEQTHALRVWDPARNVDSRGYFGACVRARVRIPCPIPSNPAPPLTAVR